jgi:hypothetical protein
VDTWLVPATPDGIEGWAAIGRYGHLLDARVVTLCRNQISQRDHAGLFDITDGSDEACTSMMEISMIQLTGSMVSMRSKIACFRTFHHTKKRQEATIAGLSPEYPRRNGKKRLNSTRVEGAYSS